ncbi:MULTISPECIES: hypothetical protein [Archaeoglobus]|jgi:hypothetical protein|uniref:Uncharacterized protein AF_1986 n=3 Tax=Archaeoglobus fulgidus TaxID=2234 RepID=Y1986_ARCFU|nr:MULTISPECIES: hypothetical protein [Archaeoglobus]O28293.1 RecName: Full=Uncharacterized protein AF_1986 [Archaeoglobus fulgidus DSM 4304]AAB89279.1 predicted coding region AF_1986 [Archaeoglobus fulgidus DSM 4304]AIG98977.1 hypothetical protein AFULGI_00022480 [Archaeoglobus fulgidus DSM 8774]KUJ93972.1 MAG: hypothetical protein XD40_0793 [Archaeoglobus fulgidus]KUK06486.1 MAG: Uncharacterized protein XD48_1261 [Archaeoglobus fulgidus]MDI3497807.1 hypothetical protein [Archaeoglobus sp.]
MLSVLLIAEDGEWHRYKELEECLINDYHVDYSGQISTDIAELSRIEFSYEIIFFLKPVEFSEIPAISRLAKSKILVFHVLNNNVPIRLSENLLPVADCLELNASAMRGKLEYFRGVDVIKLLHPYHMEVDEECEVILNGNRNTKVLLGDITFRTGKNVVFGVRKGNMAFFSADIFSNDALKESDNCRFIKNLIKELVGKAEVY